jgi:hypothetical protein
MNAISLVQARFDQLQNNAEIAGIEGEVLFQNCNKVLPVYFVISTGDIEVVTISDCSVIFTNFKKQKKIVNFVKGQKLYLSKANNKENPFFVNRLNSFCKAFVPMKVI